MSSINPNSYVVHAETENEEDMLATDPIDLEHIPGLSHSTDQPRPDSENAWSTMKRQATERILNSHPDVIRRLPDYMPDHSRPRAPVPETYKGKAHADPPPRTPTPGASFNPPLPG
ncbi:hypothetical protein VP01_1383g7 [Puccinia sorghi]|uniref:Uncharacterized protein n=1 Tax=Puccinia sorghi TaxID=27349 RepID=A0A0L6VLJ0_9BASI|nr:hypothetical protein VP01_1383g7 [Puccinia sorghi]